MVNINGSSFALQYKRTTSRPIDSTDVWDTIEDAHIYARNTDTEAYVPYAGQVISVLENGAVYKLVKDDSIPETDGKKHFKLEMIGSTTSNDDRYLRKDIENTASKLIHFLEGIDAKGVSTLEKITLLKDIASQNFSNGSTGFGIYQDESGNYHLDIDFVNIRRKLTADEIQVQRSYYVGGKQWITPGAGIVCISVEDAGAAYRCRFKSTDADGREVKCLFQVDDLAICETFNLTRQAGGPMGNHYYWRRVVGVGADYIDLGKTDCDTGSDAPMAGDEIVHLGNKTDASRQGAICSDAITTGGPYIRVYKGISDYHLPQPNIDFNPTKSTIKAKLVSEATGKDVDETFSDLQADMDLVREQADREYTIWFFDYAPTLNNAPASAWNTDELRRLHDQDLFYNKSTGLCYRFERNADGGCSWKEITDQFTVKALEDAAKAQDTADGKRRVFVAQPTADSMYDVGDLWVNATYSGGGVSYQNDSLVCITAKKKGASFSISHWKPTSTATTAVIRNLGDRITQVVSDLGDTDKAVAEAERLAEQGIDDANDAYRKALEALGIAQDADSAAYVNSTVIQQTKESITALANRISFDSSGKVTNINTSGLVTTAEFNTLLSKKVSFDASGHVTNISTSGLVTSGEFAGLFSEKAEADGYVKRAEISTFITEDEAGRLISNATIQADKINFLGKTVINGKFTVDLEGNVTMNDFTANNGTFNGTINASSGEVGGFKIGSYGLKAESGDENMLLSASLIRFLGDYSSVFIGAETMPATNGGSFSTPVRIEVNRTISSMSYGNAGLYLSVQGSHPYDNTDYQFTGNHALYISKGDICGLRFRTRRVKTSQTLSIMDTVIYVIASSTITLTLPADPEDGQFYLIRNFGSGSSVTVKANTGQKIYVNKTSGQDSDYTDHAGMQLYIYDAVNKAWLNGWFNAA